jgi:hypothetical protein
LNDPSDVFEINPRSGRLAMRNGGKLDREKLKKGFIDLVVGTLEFKPSVLSISKTENPKPNVKVRIYVADENDNSPVFLPGKNHNSKLES